MGRRTQSGIACSAVLLCVCCESATPTPRTPISALAPYSGHDAELFDDAIDPEAVGYIPSDENPGSVGGAALLRERTQSGDSVIRARVVTVTSLPENDGQSWQIALRTLEPLAGKHTPDADLVFRIDPKGPAGGIVSAKGTRLVGATFIVFLREFRPRAHEGARAGGELHFHFGKDDTAELGAVKEAALLGEVR